MALGGRQVVPSPLELFATLPFLAFGDKNKTTPTTTPILHNCKILTTSVGALLSQETDIIFPHRGVKILGSFLSETFQVP